MFLTWVQNTKYRLPVIPILPELPVKKMEHPPLAAVFEIQGPGNGQPA